MPPSERITNWFEPDWVAPRYAASRPDVNAPVVAHLRGLVGPELRVALDVGCGTGLSTRPLAEWAERALGLDASPPMLREARRAGGAEYVAGRAEALPFRSASLDLVTIGCAWHWCEPEAFLAEVARTLRPDATLAVYDSYFRMESPECPGLRAWLEAEYYARLPRPPRNPPPDPERARSVGFEIAETHLFESRVPFSRDALVTYLTTQSGAVAAVETGERSLADLEAFLRAGLATRVPETGASFDFAGPLWVLRRARR